MQIYRPRLKPYTGTETTGILFLSNPQLRTAETRALAERALACGGFAVMTGTVEEGTFSAQLLAEGKMEMLRYSVHLNHPQYEALKRANRFTQTVAYHSPQFTCAPIMII